MSGLALEEIPISQLEKDCGFSNGYLNPKKMTKIPYDWALTIASYLGISVDSILTGEENKIASADHSKRLDSDDDVKFALFGGDGEITDAMYQEVKRKHPLPHDGNTAWQQADLPSGKNKLQINPDFQAASSRASQQNP